MKKILCILLDLLTILFLIGGYVFQYYVDRKLGMVRWLNYNNRLIQETLPVELWKNIGIVGFIIITGMLIVGYKKKKEYIEKIDWIMFGIMLVLVSGYIGFALGKNVAMLNTYYFMMLFVGIATLMQVIRNGMVLILCRKE